MFENYQKKQEDEYKAKMNDYELLELVIAKAIQSAEKGKLYPIFEKEKSKNISKKEKQEDLKYLKDKFK